MQRCWGAEGAAYIRRTNAIVNSLSFGLPWPLFVFRSRLSCYRDRFILRPVRWLAFPVAGRPVSCSNYASQSGRSLSIAVREIGWNSQRRAMPGSAAALRSPLSASDSILSTPQWFCDSAQNLEQGGFAAALRPVIPTTSPCLISRWTSRNAQNSSKVCLFLRRMELKWN